MRVSRRSGDKTAIRISPILSIAIVLAGVIAVGFLVAAHPVIGIVLVVCVTVLVVLFGRAPVADREPHEHDEEPRP